jgi:hypothetical protein
VADGKIIRGGKQLCKAILDVVAKTGLNLILELGFAHNVEIGRLGFVIVFESSDFLFVKFNQPAIQLCKKIVCLTCLPVEAEN